MSKRKLYIVDDDEAVRDSLQILAESYDYAPEVFESGTAFLGVAEQLGSGCVLLDVRMPDIDGLEIQARLAKTNPGLAVIIITGHGDVPMAVKAMRAGAFDFIEKPFTDDALMESLQRAWAQHRDAAESREQNSDSEILERIEALTPRERDVLDQLIIGRPNKIIAYELGISPRTVEVHRARVMDKMKAKSLSHLVRMALSAGLQLNEE
ncbi:response regulator FixJ [Denitrobaculum tricleocarpae]|uniref:Response regulator n=1 Tax=Denitrobaculum tricleocarpae TaxID=2591009 RepID=A0A545TFB9_9PROT|nr:response regulator FixJ [Denitrobaculum tricleocarpae]TQV75927.1 response regulator [Denitrobaculum tricleocarpae]